RQLMRAPPTSSLLIQKSSGRTFASVRYLCSATTGGAAGMPDSRPSAAPARGAAIAAPANIASRIARRVWFIMASSLEQQRELGPELPVDAVRVGPVGRAVHVVLHVQRVEVVRQIEQLDADARAARLRQLHVLGDREVEREEVRIAATVVA